MDKGHSAGRAVGTCIIFQLVLSAALRVLQRPLFDAGGFLVNAAPHSTEIALSALLILVIEGLAFSVAVISFPVLCERSPRLAISFCALATVILAAAAAETATVMSLISVSDAYTKAGEAGREQLQAVRAIVSSTRNGAYTVARLADGIALFIFYAALLGSSLVPRWLAGIGIVAASLWVASVLVTFFGLHVVTLLLVPLALTHFCLALWLIAKGFRAGT